MTERFKAPCRLDPIDSLEAESGSAGIRLCIYGGGSTAEIVLSWYDAERLIAFLRNHNPTLTRIRKADE